MDSVQLGLAISLILHGSLLAWAYLVMLSTPKLEPPEPEPITVALITPSELLRLKQGSEQAKELEAKAKEQPKPEISKKEAEKPKPVEAPTPPAEPPPPAEAAKPAEPPPEPKSDPIAEKLAALPPEPPGPDPAELKRLEDQKKAEEEKKKAEEKRKADEKKKSEELKKKIEQRKKLAEAKRKAEDKKKTAADRLAALLDKDPTKRGAPLSAEPPKKETTYAGPTAGAREGTDSVLSVREQDLLKGQISAQLRGCWKLPGGGGGIETTVVSLKWHLNSDGSLDGEPEIDQPQPGQVFQVAAEAAIRAVKGCAPFTLPPEKYLAWKTIIWSFDPREMM